MNESMHSVAKIWYRLYWGLVLVFCASVAAASAVAIYLPGVEIVQQYRDDFALSMTTLIPAAVAVLYCLTLYWFINKYNQTGAMFGCSLVFTLLLLAGMTLSGQMTGEWFYLGGWLLGMFFIGIYGAPILAGALLLATVFVLMDTRFHLAGIETQHLVLLGETIVMETISYLFWRNRYADPVNHQLNQLTGMLRTKEEQAAILIQSIADGVIVTNTDGKITLMNGAAANMTGWTIEEAAGINVEQVFKVAKEKGEEIPKEEYPFTAVLAHKAFFNQVLQLTSRKGRKQIISLVISPVVTPKGEVFGAVAVLRDISEQRAAEQQRAEFISTASHEMRTPVAAIEGYLALALNDKVSTIDSRARNYLEKAHSSTEHLGKLFQDLLTSAKAEDGRLASHPTAVEMGAFLEQLVEDLRFAAQKKGLGTEFVVGSSDAIDATKDKMAEGMKVLKPLYYVNADPDRLREVITNLFDNAVKYTDQGKISIGLTGNNEVVQMYIRDTGAGIPAEDIPHLFQKFYRVDSSATRTIGGTGLGLFITRKIIELYQGRVWVESELGKGSTFFINLPRLDNQKAQELTAATTNASQSGQQPSAAQPQGQGQ
jgi:PAS domain S-box-containing protein